MLIVYGAQLLILPFQLINYATRSTDKARLRFLILALSFLTLNSVWIIPVEFWLPSDELKVLLLVFIGILQGGYFYQYLIKETGIPLNIKSANSLMLGLLIPYIIWMIQKFLPSEALQSPLYLLLIALVFEIVILTYSIRIFRALLLYRGAWNLFTYCSITSITIISFMPILLICFKGESSKNLLVNLPFFSIMTAYLFQQISQMSFESQMFSNLGIQSHLNMNEKFVEKNSALLSEELTAREREIAMLILRGTPYKDIADKLFISYSTVRKHASHVFNKVGVENKSEFINKFQGLINSTDLNKNN